MKASTSAKFVTIEAGEYSTCALDTAGAIQCWGGGYSFCANTGAQLTPRVVAGGRGYVSMSRNEMLCGLTAGGEVDCWTTYDNAPTTIPLPKKANSVSASDQACAVSVTKVLYCWRGTNGAVSQMGQ